MTRTSAPDRAAAALRETAERLRAGAREGPGRAETTRQAEALLRIAAHVAEGAEALRAALGPAGTAGDGVTVADRERAGRELYGLAQRRADKGSHRQLDAPAKPGWELGGNDLPIHRATLREAAEIYELALAVHYDSYWDYLRGLLHESLGEYAAAIRILDNLRGHYAEFGPRQAERCRRKLAGRYDQQSELDAELGRLLDAAGGNAGLKNVLRGAFGTLKTGLERARTQTDPAPASEPGAAPLESPGLERAERLARDFAEHLASGDFVAARALLAHDLRATAAEDLRRQYTQMMASDEPADTETRSGGETTATVMTGDADMPNLGPRDLGWVYVSICNAQRSEAVAVIVTEEDGQARIREIEWGRP